MKYGRRYLSAAEFEACFARTEYELYRLLAVSVFRRRGPEFWGHHQRWLEAAGGKLDWAKLYRMQVPRLLDLLCNPKSTAERLGRHWRRLSAERNKVSTGLAERPLDEWKTASITPSHGES